MKIKKRFIACFLAAVLTVNLLCEVTAFAAAGNSISDSTSISLGQTYSGSITETNTKDYYKFTLSTSGQITLTSTAYIYRLSYYIYDVNGDEVWSAYRQTWNENTEQISLSETVDLTSGTYYLAVVQYSGTGSYTFKAAFSTASESFTETTGGTNNSIAAASSISTGTTYYGQIAANDDKDYYKFTISTSGRITLTSTAYFYRVSYYIYDSDGEEVWSAYRQTWNEETEQISLDETIDLTSGTYYLAIIKYSGTGNYTFKAAFSTASESFKETAGGTNNSIAAASSISTGTTYYGQIAANDSKDFYKFTLSKDADITLTSTADIYRLSYYIYDSDGDEVWSAYRQTWNEETGKITLSETITLSAGTYYLAIVQYSGTGNYSFKISKTEDLSSATVTLSSSSFTYNGAAKKPTVTVKLNGTTLTQGTDYTVSYSNNTNAGTATVTVTGKGSYTGSKSKTFTIKQRSINSSSTGKATVSLSSTSYTYNGAAKKPTVTVKMSLNGSTKTLTKGTDYTVTYSNNTNAGTATVKITGTGNFTGTITKTFTIKQRSINSSSTGKATVTLGYTSTTYSGSARKPSVTVKMSLNGSTKTLTKGTDYTVTYSNNTSIGKATVKITGKGNFKGTITKTFTIKPKQVTISSAKSSSSKKITVKWTKLSGSVKYQIAYKKKGASSWSYKTVSASTVSKTLTGLTSGKTYYVKVRAYKTVSGTTYYGSWSSTKSVTVK